MAFRQPTAHVQPRNISTADRARPQAALATQPVELQRPVDESQEWVLFSPTAPSTAISSERTPRTAGLSRLSDFGSLDTLAGPSEEAVDHHEHAVADGDDEAGGEEEELDSLDSHLHAFREPHSANEQSGGIFPTHDGLGTFPASSTSVQAQLYSFEQFNPHRQRRRSSSARRAVEHAKGNERENERMERINEWRLEQSRLVVDEIEKETRRRRMSMLSGRSPNADEDDQVALAVRGPRRMPKEDAAEGAAKPGADDEEDSLWQRLTRRFIRDLMGIDDKVLSVIFGESLPSDVDDGDEEHVPPGDGVAHSETALDLARPGWQDRLVERIARELGVLVHQISSHPGAFSTYLRTQQPPEYVGSTTPRQRTSAPTRPTHAPKSVCSADEQSLTSKGSSIVGPQFSPTIPHTHARSGSVGHVAIWGIEEEPIVSVSDFGDDSRATFARRKEAERLRHERDYWERELDISMIFTFLKNRFRRRTSTAGAHHHQHHQHHHVVGANTSARPTTTAAARAAVIRQHHPLVSSSSPSAPSRQQANLSDRGRMLLHHQQQQSTKLHHPAPISPISAALLKRKNSSCASQSSNKSRSRRGLGAATSSGSRNYWDLGFGAEGVGVAVGPSVGSLGGSASAIASMSGLGMWGEV